MNTIVFPKKYYFTVPIGSEVHIYWGDVFKQLGKKKKKKKSALQELLISGIIWVIIWHLKANLQSQSLFTWHHGTFKRNEPRGLKWGPLKVWFIFWGQFPKVHCSLFITYIIKPLRERHAFVSYRWTYFCAKSANTRFPEGKYLQPQ